ncbi:MAG TPA: hypothetical protein VFL91_31595 [Thermomicrobiales bacterium]|nr:hypothetical protein [Thermomicrobiales bacterium]
MAKQMPRRVMAALVLALVLVGFDGLAGGTALAATPGASGGRRSPREVALPAGGTREGDALGLRFALVGALALALAAAATAQYRAVARGRGAVSAADAEPAPGRVPGPRAADRTHAVPTGDRERASARHASLTSPAPAPRAVASLAAPSAAQRPDDPALACCARAVAAAHAYDRRATLDAFLAALAHDPGVRPSQAPGFWEMPSGGHADLARAYLQCGRPRDARTVLTVASLTFPHQRELEALAREADGARRAS